MLKKLSSWAAALILGAVFAVSPAQAATQATGAVASAGNKGFYYGASSPQHLALLIEAALILDPSGQLMLDPKKCVADGSCGSPVTYLEAIKRADPTAPLSTVQDIPKFLRTLEKRMAPPGVYSISCIYSDGHGNFRVVMGCLKRPFEKDGMVWVDPRTAKVIFDQHCTNPPETSFVPPPVTITVIGGNPSDCYELEFNAPVGGRVRWGIGTVSGPFAPSDCNAQKQGEGSWAAWYGECEICVLSEVYLQRMQQDLGPNMKIPHKFVYPVTQRKQTLRFSEAVLRADVYVCLEDATGKQTCGVLLMRPQDWKGAHHVAAPDSIWLWGGDPRCPAPLSQLQQMQEGARMGKRMGDEARQRQLQQQESSLPSTR